MTNEQYLKNLEVPEGKIDVVLDTDAYNEIDDQFAISYMLRSDDKLNVKAIYAAPFYNTNSSSPEDGMVKSYDEILKILELADRTDLSDSVYYGSTHYLENEQTPVISDAAKHLAALAKNYSPEKPLYVIAIAAITNVASAILLDKTIAENIVIVWLTGTSRECPSAKEFNLMQDIAGARVVFSCGAPIVQLPCAGVVSAFTTTGPELNFWLTGKNKLSDYLSKNTIKAAEEYAAGKPWSRPIWDVTAVAWLLNENNRFMGSKVVKIRLPEYDDTYSKEESEQLMRYVYIIERDTLMKDLFDKLTKQES